MYNTGPSLSKREVALLAAWERTGVNRVTTADLAKELGVTKPRAALILTRLANKGALDHIGRGVYGVRPMRAIDVPWATSGLVAVATLLDGRDYYVGGPVALTAHHLTEQVHHSVVDVFIADRRRSQRLSHTRIIFHSVRWPKAYHLGITPVSIGSVNVRMSDPERTLLDLIDRPDLLGSARSTITTVRNALGIIDVDRLISYAACWPRRATRQRLGYMLDQAGLGCARLYLLLSGKRPTNVVPLLVDEPSRGPIHSPWRVRANDIGDATGTATEDG